MPATRRLSPVAAGVLGLGCSLLGAVIVLLGLGVFGEPPLAEGVPAWIGVPGGVVFVLECGARRGVRRRRWRQPRTATCRRGRRSAFAGAVPARARHHHGARLHRVLGQPSPRAAAVSSAGTFGGGAVSETLGRAVSARRRLTWLLVITLGVVGLRRLGRRCVGAGTSAITITGRRDARAAAAVREGSPRWIRERRNWGRGGKDDQKGALNLVTPAKRAAAARLVRSGRSVSLRPAVPEGARPQQLHADTIHEDVRPAAREGLGRY